MDIGDVCNILILSMLIIVDIIYEVMTDDRSFELNN